MKTNTGAVKSPIQERSMNVQEERLSPSVRKLWVRYYSENTPDQLEDRVLEQF